MTPDDLDEASAWLARNGLVAGFIMAEREGPVRAHLTDDGHECAEDYESDVRTYIKRKEASMPSGAPTVHVTTSGGNVMVALGDGSQQTMNLQTGAGELVLRVAGVAELLRALNLADPQELDAAETEALNDLTSPEPTGEATKRFLGRVTGWAAKAASPALTHVLVAAGDDALREAEKLFGAIPT